MDLHSEYMIFTSLKLCTLSAKEGFSSDKDQCGAHY